jgi:hypothetical protein
MLNKQQYTVFFKGGEFMDYIGQTAQAWQQEQAQQESKAKSRTFNVGSLIPSIIMTIANPAAGIPMLLKTATAEAGRAMTGSDIDPNAAVSYADQFLPQAPAAQTPNAPGNLNRGTSYPGVKGATAGTTTPPVAMQPQQTWLGAAGQGMQNVGYAAPLTRTEQVASKEKQLGMEKTSAEIKKLNRPDISEKTLAERTRHDKVMENKTKTPSAPKGMTEPQAKTRINAVIPNLPVEVVQWVYKHRGKESDLEIFNELKTRGFVQ